MITSTLTNRLVTIVDEMYMYHAGPMGNFICEEALENWKARDANLNYLNLTSYIDDLCSELPEGNLQKKFIEELLTSRDIIINTAIKGYLDNMLSSL